MIITTAKQLDNLFDVLKEHQCVFLIGCGSCAAACHTGGEEDIIEIKKVLEEHNKTITGYCIPKETCHHLLTRKELIAHKQDIDKSGCIMVFSCGAGVQAVVSFYEDKEVYSALDTLFLGNVHRFGKFSETCSMCGQCVLNKTGGICPVTRCAKGLLNGPCGGAKNGKCEVNPENECVWVSIYERLKKLGRLDKLVQFKEPKDYSLKRKPFHLNITLPKKNNKE
ncbi:methylenetetrahydrofolate reductase C-terminal domain-containing protein [bacterium]|nr:methylenetetrahydrofolate reductase C-terminal domain-containing protein [bacterium]